MQDLVDIFLVGFGSVGQHVAKLLLQRDRKRPPLRVVGISDSRGALSRAEGIDLEKALRCKREGNRICDCEIPGATVHQCTMDMIKSIAKRGDIILEGSPVDLTTGGVGLECCRYALSIGVHVVLANKAPLVLAFHELHETAALSPKSRLAFSATVCGGLPVVNVGQRDLGIAEIDSVCGVLNSTSNYILSRMARGEDSGEALRAAQASGIAEADPTLDVDGFDTANKLVIIANAVLGYNCNLESVSVEGIGGIGWTQIAEAATEGKVYRLVARAVREEEGEERSFRLTVRPEKVEKYSFLGSCEDTDMCVVFRSDEFETISLKTDEKGVFPTASAMLRDCALLLKDEKEQRLRCV